MRGEFPSAVAPARERGLKCKSALQCCNVGGRSREGAWIEMLDALTAKAKEMVAPARERGLK